MRVIYTEAGLKLVPTKKEKALADKLDKWYNEELQKAKDYYDLTGYGKWEYDELLYDGIGAFNGEAWENAMYAAGYAQPLRDEVYNLSTDRAKKLVKEIKDYWWDERFDKMRKEGLKVYLDFRKDMAERYKKTHVA